MSTMGVVVSVTDLTTQAGWMAALAIAALVFAGWRKNARAVPRTPRAEPKVLRPRVPIGIAEATVPLYKRPNIFRRIWAAAASLGIAVVMGAVFAIIVAFSAAYIVITLTDLLKS
ncbi:hypothetical protein YM304_05070 [Ilumatobacter coccineus YM16-304]|uniref:Uncharacterized protein n=1 Tax=Ilumatobacter coccineus (strain NBRC 103263 / KCTC 29153 / YM16-304) TaxID=1313172 RepID=A0A6C7E1S5_ILUCY|nr:hypothetical protein YM304_05070 [Ilumatobacter coccineus YM16-304]